MLQVRMAGSGVVRVSVIIAIAVVHISNVNGSVRPDRQGVIPTRLLASMRVDNLAGPGIRIGTVIRTERIFQVSAQVIADVDLAVFRNNVTWFSRFRTAINLHDIPGAGNTGSGTGRIGQSGASILSNFMITNVNSATVVDIDIGVGYISSDRI